MNTGRVDRVERFDGVERAVHWSLAGLSGILLATAAVLFIPSLAAVAGGRALARDLHVGAGFLLPVPLLVALAGRWGSRLRDDVARLNRWDASDRRWLRTFGRAAGAGAGKFNAGQKLNAAFLLGAMLVMLGTGALLRWHRPVPLSWRTGATFVHDWLALALVAVLAGHVAMVLAHPESLRGMVTGRVRRGWAERHHPRWVPGRPSAPVATGTVGTGTVETGDVRWGKPALLLTAAAGCAFFAGGALLPLFAADEPGRGPDMVAGRFQRALERNDLEQAYDLLSTAARSRGLSREAFFRRQIRQQDDRYLEPGQPEPHAEAVTVERLHRAGRFAQVAVKVTMSDGRTIRRQVELSRAGRAWAVDRFFLLNVDDSCVGVGSTRPKGCHGR